MFNSSIFSIFDVLNSSMTAIATIFMYAIAIALPICIIQSVIARYINTTAVGNEFHEQVKDLMSLEVQEIKNSGVALAITVEPVVNTSIEYAMVCDLV